MVGHNKHEVVMGDSQVPEGISSASDKALEEAANLLEVVEQDVEPLSPLELEVAEERLNGIAFADIAKRLGLSLKVVRLVLGRPRVKAYIKDISESITANNKDVRMAIMSQLIEQKLEEEGLTSKLDLATLLQMQDSMGKVKEQAEVGGQNNVMINILNAISKDNS